MNKIFKAVTSSKGGKGNADDLAESVYPNPDNGLMYAAMSEDYVSAHFWGDEE